ncbi:MAG: porphobilinogen synthase [Deltaproteobacteria bacterium]|nr:porphobilinogen synthase [Deltaproteobacteria bacterium]
MVFPIVRPRRLRQSAVLRSMVRETRLSPEQLIYPLFVVEGDQVKKPISSMPGQFQLSVDHLKKEAQSLKDLGIPAVILFGIPSQKDEQGTVAWKKNNIINRAIQELKEHAPDLYVITDECFCEYTSHGHCGILKNGDVDNDATLANLAKQAVNHAQAGADMVAPSGMMDGMVDSIRAGLDEEGFQNVPIMSYAVKYASAFYGPFREAAECAPGEGDRSTYQMDPANAREALREADLDVSEGADILMVKPALAYLDIIQGLKDEFDVPIAAYHVSGEYAMIKAAAQNGWLDEEKAMMESLTSIRRAGADLIITYYAKEAAKIMRR